MRILLLAMTILFASGVSAQADDRLPGTLSGRWMMLAPGGRTFIDAIKIVVDGNGGPGTVTGRLTVRGVSCGAIDEPLAGTWDGAVLRFESLHRAGVNAQRVDGQCGDGKATYELRRRQGAAGFEGEGKMGNFSWSVSVSPGT